MSENNTCYFIIGGAPSTGSSLLRQILNRHSQVYCGNEIHLFCKPSLYRSWSKEKYKIFRKSIFGLASSGLHSFTGLDVSDLDSSIRENLKSNISSSTSFFDYVATSFITNKSEAIGDKTPANCFHFEDFHQQFNDGKSIHIVRNPYDVVSSLQARGKSLFEACCLYLLNTCYGLGANMPESKHLILKYENLVSMPEKEVVRICSFLNLDFENIMLESSIKGMRKAETKLQGWNYDETEKIGKKSVGRFDTLTQDEKQKIVFYLNHILIDKPNYSFPQMLLDLSYSTIEIVGDYRQALRSDFDLYKQNQRFSIFGRKKYNYPIYV